VEIPWGPEGHDLYLAARRSLRAWELVELSSDMDAVARDLVQEYALAVLEGRDGPAAMMEARQAWARDRARTVHGLALVDGLDR
jgi:hypothetical protein